MKIGILGAASIARNRFLPALKHINGLECGGVAARDPNSERLLSLCSEFGIMRYPSYDALLNAEEIDAVYIPLPPAIHFEWAQKALLKGKHVFLEKPATLNLMQLKRLVILAKEHKKALFENYMFLFHTQFNKTVEVMNSGKIGKLRLIRGTFSFPRRNSGDFRYNKELGGGALLDAGGYVVKLATTILGQDTEILTATLNYEEGDDVDLYGSFTAKNGKGLIFQGAFGIDNCYQCSLEIYGQKVKLVNQRIFTAGPEVRPCLKIYSNAPVETIDLPQDDHFAKSQQYFLDLINSDAKRDEEYKAMILQAEMMNAIKEHASV